MKLLLLNNCNITLSVNKLYYSKCIMSSELFFIRLGVNYILILVYKDNKKSKCDFKKSITESKR